MLSETQPTPFDVEFSLFGIPVRVSPWFWAGSCLLGWNPDRPDVMIIWVMCVFISILVHEMGHALMASAFRQIPHVVLGFMGGYAAYRPDSRYTLSQAIIVTAAGPLAGFVLYGLTYVLLQGLFHYRVNLSDGLLIAFQFLLYINLVWGLINLLPVLPLDGGQICRDLLSLNRRWDGLLWATYISIAVGFGMAVYFSQAGYRYPAVFFGIMALLNLQSLGGRSNSRW